MVVKKVFMTGTSQNLTHFDNAGQAHMVDIGAKKPSFRMAIATGRITMSRATYESITAGNSAKGDVLGIARIAAIQATKRTAELIPLCHPVALSHVAVEFILHPTQPAVECRVNAQCTGSTGVEMEALTGVQIGLLTIYDMCKAIDRAMTIEDVRLLEKRGGKSGAFVANP